MRFLRHNIIVPIVLLILLTACATAALPSPTAPTDPLDVGDPARGQDFFETGGGKFSNPCQRCHSLDGVDGQYAPTLQGIAVRGGERVEGMNAEEYLRQSILDPGAYLVDGYEDKMEHFYEVLLTEDDVNDIVAYLLTQ